MKWGAPDRVLWLWILPLALVLIWAGRRTQRRRLARLCDAMLWSAMLSHLRPGRRRLRDALWLAAVALLLVALARPQWGFRWEEVQQRGLQILVLLDTSNSMRAADLLPSRFQQAHWGVRDLVRRLRGDRIGLIAFAGTAFLQCPLTSDYAAFAMMLDDVRPGTVPRGGTAIARALREAVKRFDYKGMSDRVIVLLSDGEDHEEDPATVIPLLREKGIRVYAVGVGTPEGELVRMPDGSFLKDRAGQIVKTRLVEETLKRLALETGGAYVRAVPGDFGLERLYDEHIARLQREEFQERMEKVHEDRFAWFVAAALVLLGLEMVIPTATGVPDRVGGTKPGGGVR